ncbi:hypothetical protein [Psychroserpens sp. SPM9]|uniref:hypothetical protein n=1 Tax=Psychroserpens sp. SPM9 TaxID=2975598 RepID=UPI0021A62E8E|nr:hypothetical protein [Psychroserpens sp. SPM9]MDG5490972.1 hypothetical protein [Psychroserpens sp. SPM9]
MKVSINGLRVDKSLISVNSGLNYGRFDYTNLEVSKYKIILASHEFIALIEDTYNSVRDEIKQDDEAQNETSAFTTINYGSITQLLQNQQALQDITTTYLDLMLFDKLFTQSNNPHYIINSTEQVEMINDNIEISGISYRKQ